MLVQVHPNRFCGLLGLRKGGEDMVSPRAKPPHFHEEKEKKCEWNLISWNLSEMGHLDVFIKTEWNAISRYARGRGFVPSCPRKDTFTSQQSYRLWGILATAELALLEEVRYWNILSLKKSLESFMQIQYWPFSIYQLYRKRQFLCCFYLRRDRISLCSSG